MNQKYATLAVRQVLADYARRRPSGLSGMNIPSSQLKQLDAHFRFQFLKSWAGRWYHEGGPQSREDLRAIKQSNNLKGLIPYLTKMAIPPHPAWYSSSDQGFLRNIVSKAHEKMSSKFDSNFYDWTEDLQELLLRLKFGAIARDNYTWDLSSPRSLSSSSKVVEVLAVRLFWNVSGVVRHELNRKKFDQNISEYGAEMLPPSGPTPSSSRRKSPGPEVPTRNLTKKHMTDISEEQVRDTLFQNLFQWGDSKSKPTNELISKIFKAWEREFSNLLQKQVAIFYLQHIKEASSMQKIVDLFMRETGIKINKMTVSRVRERLISTAKEVVGKNQHLLEKTMDTFETGRELGDGGWRGWPRPYEPKPDAWKRSAKF